MFVITCIITSMARNSLLCADVPLRNYSLTHPPHAKQLYKFSHADDVVLLVPSWYALRQHILIFEKCCNDLRLICSVKKTKCMDVNPLDKTRIVSKSFPHFCINGQSDCSLFMSFVIWVIL